jgi:hypothetical protein
LKDFFRGSQDNYFKNGQGFIFVYSVTSNESIDYLLNIKDEITRLRKCTIDKVWKYYFFDLILNFNEFSEDTNYTC